MLFHNLQGSSSIVFSKKARDSFEKFIDGRIVANNEYDWEMVKVCDFSPKSVGFMSSSNEFYAITDDELILMEINADFNDSVITSRKNFSDSFLSFSQNRSTPEIFAIAKSDSTSIYNAYSGEEINIPSENVKRRITWMNNTTFMEASESGFITLFDIEAQKITETRKAFQIPNFTKIIAHPTEPLAIIASSDKIQLIDTRKDGFAMEMDVKEGLTTVNWMPGDKSGFVTGNDDGSVNFYSLNEKKDLYSQNISNSPITTINFCPSMSEHVIIGCQSELLFANLRIWGFGRLTLSKIHQGHVGNIVDAQWWEGPELRVISCDDKNMINMFQMSDEFLPKIDPQSI